MASKKTGRPVGAPSDYKPEFADKAARWYGKGCTDAEVADKLSVAVSTLYEWKKKHKEFSEAREKGKELANDEVEAALFKRATGMTLPDTHFSTWDGIVTATPTEKHIPPDPTSMIFFLKNRRPKDWREKTETVLTDPSGKNPFDALAIAVAQQIHKQKA